MIVAVNTRVLSGNLSARKQLVQCFEMIAFNYPEHTFIFIAEKQFTGQNTQSKNIKRIVLPQQSPNQLLWKLWYNYKLPAVLRKCKADVLISADGVCCLRTKLPQCLLLYDLALLNHAEWYPKKYLQFIKTNEPAFLQKAKRVVIFSGALKKEIIQQYKIDENKIAVLYPAADPKYQPIDWEPREHLKEKYTQGKEYFLFCGAIHPASNLTNLLKAFSLIKKRQKTNMQLIIASGDASADTAFVESLKLYKYRNEIKLLVNLDEKSLQTITASAYAFINLSPLHTEMAFLLNAMQCNVPVIAGNFNAAIEILEDAALYANETLPEDIAEKLILLYKDENRRREFIQKAAHHSKKFTLNNLAIRLWQNILATIQPL